jgi:hypothetical protein
MWKKHFAARIAGLPPLFPLAHWCRLTMQSNATLNMIIPCCLNPLLSAHKALVGTFLFNAPPMALLGTEILIHLKPSRCKMWGYHAAKAWYLSHAATHYQCIWVIMKDTGSKHVTDTFHYQHNAILVPFIMATDCIMEATWRLTNAINGVQEMPPNKMAVIHMLHALFLGKVPAQEPEPPPQTCRPKKPLRVSPQAKPEHNNAPIFMWNPAVNGLEAAHKL